VVVLKVVVLKVEVEDAVLEDAVVEELPELVFVVVMLLAQNVSWSPVTVRQVSSHKCAAEQKGQNVW
jgi:hypothetical protein